MTQDQQQIKSLTEMSERLNDENKKLIIKCVESMTREVSARHDVECLKRIIKNQSLKVDAFKKLFWRIYFK